MSIYDQTFKISTGEDIPLSIFKDKVLLIVNVATNCGFTPQYKALQTLHDRYSEAGLKVIAFPCNQFKGQEPGTDTEIAEFCSTNYGVTFEFASKTADADAADADPTVTSALISSLATPQAR